MGKERTDQTKTSALRYYCVEDFTLVFDNEDQVDAYVEANPSKKDTDFICVPCIRYN